MNKLWIGLISWGVTIVILVAGVLLFAGSLDLSNVRDAADRLEESDRDHPNVGENGNPGTPDTPGTSGTPGDGTVPPDGTENPGDTEPPAEKPSVKEQMVTLVENYNEANREVIQEVFRKYTEDLYEPENTKGVAYANIVNTYVDHLFDTIAEQAEMEAHDDQLMEAEAKAYETYVTFLDKNLSGTAKDTLPKGEEIHEMMDAVAESEACYNTLSEIVYDQETVVSCQQSFSELSEEKKMAFAETLVTYAVENQEDERKLNASVYTMAILGIYVIPGQP